MDVQQISADAADLILQKMAGNDEMAEPDAQLAPRVLIAVGDTLLRRVASTGF